MRRVGPPLLATMATLTLLPVAPTTAHADSRGEMLDSITVDRRTQEIEVSWDDVPQASEYVIFDEVPKDSVHDDPTQPVYRGENTQYTLTDLPTPSSVRLRLAASIR
ncbi:hypothetical protein RIF23_15515 [Lipingzhangella sp. LS1_29]|uniref:Fibronectin type-III domain-containing protein n=1 Tax=Lipingzhangella rawalii TaxID=2055835 RepID=A0ABU2H8R8_9ACTN|nr:hypothetical protein [Lipingzhangella rawalii]MDS1271703.1 hypothetical protein [Lipingzhangella rawalii]